jgi:acetyl-CoA carboxylase biotin carboxylase subunit
VKRVLIANRGEIAVRIMRACREAGLESVAIYSDADRTSRHVLLADHAVRVGPPPARDSYLNIPVLVDAAHSTKADSVHPGYGFLSERGAFARACEEAGLTFIGPPAAVIERMGSKVEARNLMTAAGVPVVPGLTPRDQSDDGIVAAARELGYPVLVKASAGGGGKGMRSVEDDATVRDAVGAARREALAAFADGTLYVERLIRRPRHIEVQVLADDHGGVIHLFERECSVQRRHQKVIEESPSPALTPTLRARMGEAAVAAARAANYRNAGTIEFLLEGEGDRARFYFLEMNTRIQVEHPVTEVVTDTDLVRAQIEIAGGATLPWTQDSLRQRGHAIECRLYAEDPAAGFLPQAGPLTLYREPAGPGIRVDSGVVEGDDISVHYDPLIAKLTVHAEDRARAISRATAALRTYPILGVRTNLTFLIAVLEHPSFAAGAIHTSFIDQYADELLRVFPPPPEALAAAAVTSSEAGPATDALRLIEPWDRLYGWGR